MIFIREIVPYFEPDQKLDFNKHINEKSLNHKKVHQSSKSVITFCQEMYFMQYINHLFDHIWITEILKQAEFFSQNCGTLN